MQDPEALGPLRGLRLVRGVIFLAEGLEGGGGAVDP